MHIRDWFERARTEGFAIGAFNVSNLETLKAVIEAAKAERSPVLLESSDGETAYVGSENLVDLVENARRETGLPIFLNLDHSRTPEKVEDAVRAGYDLVHYDGSKETPEINVANLRKLREITRKKDVLLEGELDYIIEGSEVRQMTAEEGRAQSKLTDPKAAHVFVEETGIDTFAVSIGNVHGLYTTPIELDLVLLDEIRRELPCYLSLHGGSGIPDEQVRAAIERGRIVKVNVSTELRKAMREGLEESFDAQPAEVAMYKLAPAAIAEMQQIVQKKMRLFGSSGTA